MLTPTNARDTGSTTASRQRLPNLPRLVRMSKGYPTFGLSRATLQRAAAAGEIRLVKVGSGTFLETETVLAWLDRLPTITPKAAA